VESRRLGPAEALPALSDDEIVRYSRHLLLPTVGMEGQRVLKAGRVLIVGVGGLGNPAAIYLAAAGVGKIGLLDKDIVEKSNLHRQILYSESDIGKSKVDVAKNRLKDVNPNINVETYELVLDSSNAMQLLKEYDVVIDGTDNFPARYLINDACVLLGKPEVYASIFRFDGQATVFYSKAGPCYRCLFPEPPPPDTVPSCADGGVLGVLPGIMGSIQAIQAINLLLGRGEPLIGRLLLFDATDTTFNVLKIRKNPQCPACGTNPTITKLIDYEQFCGIDNQVSADDGISPTALKARMDAGSRIVLLDVREPFEYQICHLSGAKLIPSRLLAERMSELNTADEVVVYCHVGTRSARAAEFLRGVGFSKVKNLNGGIRAWAEQVDPTMTRY
jgi:adenylyltransferase/sulfurtransferase